MEKIEGNFKDELIQYKTFFGLYIVEVHDPLSDISEYWIMKEDKIIEKIGDRLTAYERLGEHIGYLDQQNEMRIDEELERRAIEKGEEYEPEYYGDEDID